ncbi:MAG: O-antigen ligase family protein [Chloroflexi bacterium]|nr:O-antigen ligase family protein [Chloroflexota bacterium]
MSIVAQAVSGNGDRKRLIGVAGIAGFVLLEMAAGFYAARWQWLMIGPLFGGLLLVLLLKRSPLELLLLWFLVGFPLRFWQGVSLVEGMPNLTLDRALLGAGLLVLLAQALVRQRRLTRLDLADVFVILYVVFSLLSLLLQADDLRHAGLNFAIRDLLPVVAYFLARNLLQTEGAVRQLLWVVRWPALVVAIWALIEQVLGIQLLTGEPIVGIGASSTIIRSSSGVGHPSATGTALAMLLPFILHGYAHDERRLTRMLTLAQVGLMGIAVYFTFVRVTWVAFALVILIMAMLHPRLRRLCGTMVLVVVVAVVVFWPRISDSTVYLDKVTDPRDIPDRLFLADVQWEMFKQNPIIGVGGTAASSLSLIADSSHNTYLNLLADVGLLGFIPYILPLAMVFVQSLVAFRRLPRDSFIGRGLVVSLWCALLAYTINALSVDLRFYSILIGTYWVALSLLMLVSGPAGGVPASSKEQVEVRRPSLLQATGGAIGD